MSVVAIVMMVVVSIAVIAVAVVTVFVAVPVVLAVLVVFVRTVAVAIAVAIVPVMVVVAVVLRQAVVGYGSVEGGAGWENDRLVGAGVDDRCVVARLAVVSVLAVLVAIAGASLYIETRPGPER